jgi:thymidine kinase
LAHFHPSLPPRRALTAGDHAELAVLRLLEDGLSDAYTLFHSVDWTDAAGMEARHGEVDIVIVNQAGDVMQLEVKAGVVDFTSNGIFKTYAGTRKDVAGQLNTQYGAMPSRLGAAGLSVKLLQRLVLTDARAEGQTARWPREHIIDSAEWPHLCSRVQAELGPGTPTPATQRAVADFFGNVFRVQPDVSALAGRMVAASTRLSSGLATWVPRLRVPSGIVRVVGTAGSGKTQLALRLLRDAAAQGQRGAYVCFNRALADHMATVVPVTSQAETFHQMADRMCRAASQPVDYAADGAFAALAGQAQALLANRPADLDLLVLDELQDLQPEWAQALTQRVKPEGRLILLEDPEQQLYADREPFAVEGEAVITSNENFRSPRALVRLCNLLRLTQEPVEPLGPHEGTVPDPVTYADPRGLLNATRQAVQRCLDLGFALEDVAVITLRGRGSSALLKLDQLGLWQLRRFTGAYDEQANPMWTPGPLLADTVYRFKGQSAPAVVLTECDFEQWDEKARRSLFVGLTRARVHLEWVVSERAGEVLAQAV